VGAGFGPQGYGFVSMPIVFDSLGAEEDIDRVSGFVGCPRLSGRFRLDSNAREAAMKDKEETETKDAALTSERPLQSWKEIAAYLERDERTARRWEQSLGLPIHRYGDTKGGSVYAFVSEIESWRSHGSATEHRSWLRRWSLSAAVGILALASAVWFVRYGPIFNPPNPLVEAAENITVREVCASSTEGGPSPDGRYLSFTDWKTGNLAIEDLTTGEKKLLTKIPAGSKDYVLWSAFSPDGTQIAYDWYLAKQEFCELRIMDLEKGDSRTLLDADAGFYREGVSWSRDQSHIATVIIGEKQKKIAWVSTENGATRVLTSLGESMPGGPNSLFPSPDDRYLAYSYTSRKDPSNFDIFLVSTDGSGETVPLVEHPANDRVLGWIPGRDELLFLSDRSGSWDVWVLSVKKGQPAGEPVRVYPNLGDVAPIEVYSRWMENYVSNFDPETGKFIGSLTQPLSGYKQSLDWSPDGRRLAYVQVDSTPEGPGFLRGFLHIRDLESGADREIPCGIAVVEVRWSADGKSLLMSGMRERKVIDYRLKTSLYVVDTQTGKVQPVADRPDSRIVIGDWSADGKGIYFVDGDRIVLHDLETGRERTLLTEPDLVGPLALSPDGALLAASLDDREKSSGLIMVDVASGKAVRTVDIDRASAPSADSVIRGFDWSADGKYLFYLERGRERAPSLWLVPRQGGTPEKVWQTDKYVRGLRILPDGKRLSFGQIRHETSVWVMEGLVSEPSAAEGK
jgi:Tol biopolymer transport system component